MDTLSHRGRDNDVYLLCSDGLTSMVSEELVREILVASESLEEAGKRLIAAANDAGGRDNITVVLFRLEAVGEESEEVSATAIGIPAPSATEVREALDREPVPKPSPRVESPRRRRLVPRTPSPAAGATSRRRGLPRAGLAALATLVALAVVATGGWIASQSVYFIGTDAGGRITVYRGVPYDLPAGIALYQPNFVSGVTVADLAAAERGRLLDQRLRSHGDATDLVRRLELGQVSKP